MNVQCFNLPPQVCVVLSQRPELTDTRGHWGNTLEGIYPGIHIADAKSGPEVMQTAMLTSAEK